MDRLSDKIFIFKERVCPKVHCESVLHYRLEKEDELKGGLQVGATGKSSIEMKIGTGILKALKANS